MEGIPWHRASVTVAQAGKPRGVLVAAEIPIVIVQIPTPVGTSRGFEQRRGAIGLGWTTSNIVRVWALSPPGTADAKGVGGGPAIDLLGET